MNEFCPLCDRRLKSHAGAVRHYKSHARYGDMREVEWSPDGTLFVVLKDGQPITDTFIDGYRANGSIYPHPAEALERGKAAWWAKYGIKQVMA